MNALNKYLSQFAEDERIELFLQKIEQRTRYLTVCLEDVYQSQNASAVLRTCEALGIQDVHIVEIRNIYQLNPKVVRGAAKWLTLHKYNSQQASLDAIKNLKNNGYRIVATSPHGKNISLEDFDLTKGKTAIFFGTEATGVSETVMQNADEFLTIPMFGFVESFNLSVSAAIVLYRLSMALRHLQIDWHLSNADKDEVMLQWLRVSISRSDDIIKKYESINNVK